MAVVQLNIEEFKSLYPELVSRNDAALENDFFLATGFLDNSDSSPVCCETERKRLLYLLTAHIASMASHGAAVGAITGATEGKVTVSFASPGGNVFNFLKQTQYGLLYLRLTAKYRIGGRYYAYIPR